MFTIGWILGVIIAAIWGAWDWRVVATGVIIALVADAILFFNVFAPSSSDNDGY
jgi:hypothetical protein